MDEKQILNKINEEIMEYRESNYKEKSRNCSKEERRTLRVKTPVVRKLSAKYFKEIKIPEKYKIFSLCEELLKKECIEYSIIAFDWSFRLREFYEKHDFRVFEKWVNLYIDDWWKCDDFSTHTLGYFIMKYPQFINDLKEWAKTDNRWFRRAAAVSMIPAGRKGKFLFAIFEIADILLTDKDDLVRKGYGWMLKETGKKYPEKVFEYVMKNKKVMTRTALRYAIEKLPEDKRREAMKK